MPQPTIAMSRLTQCEQRCVIRVENVHQQRLATASQALRFFLLDIPAPLITLVAIAWHPAHNPNPSMLILVD